MSQQSSTTTTTTPNNTPQPNNALVWAHLAGAHEHHRDAEERCTGALLRLKQLCEAMLGDGCTYRGEYKAQRATELRALHAAASVELATVASTAGYLDGLALLCEAAEAGLDTHDERALKLLYTRTPGENALERAGAALRLGRTLFAAEVSR